MFASATEIVTITLNPAIDRIIEVPNFEVGRHMMGRRIDVYPAGKGIRVSRVLARLGTRSIATGFVGERELELFEAFLGAPAAGRAVPQMLRVNRPTRENVTIVDPINDRSTYVREEGFEISQKDLERIQGKIGLMARQDAILCFCGSIPPGLGTDVFQQMVRRAIDSGARVVLDTMGEALHATRDLPVWMIRMNRTTAGEIAGHPVASRDDALAMSRFLSRHGAMAAVTVGAEGAAFCTAGQAWTGHIGIHPGLVINTVGCGESFVAGLLHEWRRTGDWAAAFREGLSVATVNATTVRSGEIDAESREEFRRMAVIESR
jgi:1-phosphofructokinase family hexose kinase